jgi:murein DD-endopeptidase MepM/ murein hydrolase activator NlpD
LKTRPLPAIVEAVTLLTTQVRDGLKAYPRQIAVALGVVLFGAGATAFGVAPFLPDPATVPVREHLETVNSSVEIAPQIDALRQRSLELYRSDTLTASDSLETAFRKLGLQDASAMAFIRSDATARALVGRHTKLVTASAIQGSLLKQLTARWISDDSGHFNRLVIEKTDGGWSSRMETGQLTRGTTLGSGIIRTSLFAATDEARLPDNVASQLVRLFEGDVDFHRGMRRGDRFSLQYETLEADGEVLRTGKVLSAQLTNNGTTHSAMWFDVGGGKGDYYSFDGESRQRTYLASPLEFSRVSSGFAMRLHPIHKTWKKHLGVDYAAPTGTPVRAVGDGVVINAGWNASGYGNVVEIRHRNASHTTLYAHLSKVAVRKGQPITQGTVIGNVGSTGWSTGPHLHFEFRVGGAHQDPLKLVRAKETIPLPVAAKPAFEHQVNLVKQGLEQIASYVPARAE